ncbi:APC family permease [Corynebacterium sp. 13CS0277]|uniref:APC family permease n=1 Tax=Corynebacterium sp. 13CS0277 TaxID=2071994 RepID=UPI001304D174|nr:APC family permease [Corynebacterium sp. 13CS0277]
MFLIIAASAPLTVVAGGAPTSFAVTQMLGVPLGYLVLGIVLLFFAAGYVAMGRHVSNAGALYAYAARGLGQRQGLATAWLALVSYNMMQIGLYGIFGFSLSMALAAIAGWQVSWWWCALGGWLLTAVLGAMNIDASVKIIGVLVVAEFAIVALLDAVALLNPAEGYSAAGVDLSAFVAHPGVGAALAFGMAAFMGIESATIYAEEATDPTRTVPRATYWALALIAGFYAFSVWALQQGVGDSRIVEEATTLGPELVFHYLAQVGHPTLALVGQFVFVTSLFAALFAFHNAVARYTLVLGREGVLPEWFSRTHPTTHAPMTGSLSQSLVAVLFILGFATVGEVTHQGPEFPVLTMFSWMTNGGAFGIVFLLLVTSVAVGMYFRRARAAFLAGSTDTTGTTDTAVGTTDAADTNAAITDADTAGPGGSHAASPRHPGSYSAFTRVLAPIIAVVGLGFVFAEILLHFDVMVGADGINALVVGMPAVIFLSGVAGFLRGEVLRRTQPEVYARIGTGGAAAVAVSAPGGSPAPGDAPTGDALAAPDAGEIPLAQRTT